MTSELFNKLKPGISKRYILLIAAFIWTMAGVMLFVRGAFYVLQFSNFKAIHFLIAILFGIGFFWVLFKKISFKHIHRIKNIEIEKPCIFSFFNFKSYLIMGLMITMGIMLRKSGHVNKDILYTFYVGMGIPLLISAGRFYKAWFKDQNTLRT
jgi:hypothetical protein